MGQSLADYGRPATNLVWSADALPLPGMEPLVIPTMNTLLGRARQSQASDDHVRRSMA
jgi:hypothetical protein